MATKMAKIFISYDRASKDVVEQLVQDLTDDDHEIWFDQHLTARNKLRQRSSKDNGPCPVVRQCVFFSLLGGNFASETGSPLSVSSASESGLWGVISRWGRIADIPAG
jgi:hypothetical protein